MIDGGANGAYIILFFAFFISAISFVAIIGAATGGLIPLLLAGLGLVGWIQGVMDFLALGKKLSKIEDKNTADEVFNSELADIILPIFFGWILGKGVSGLGQSDYEEDLFLLIINDIILSYFYGMFD